jgi:CRP-like cAMP-binding protein
MNRTDSNATEVKELLESHPFARGLSGDQIEALVPCGRVARFRERAIVFREGDTADALYLIARGRVVLEQHIPGKREVQLESLTGGDMLGLSWLFPGGRWVLEARAVSPTVTVVVDAGCVRARMDADPALGLVLAKHIIHQLYQRLERVRLQRLDVYRSDQ